jgi:hypothetical protein
MGTTMDDDSYLQMEEIVDEESKARRADPLTFVANTVEILRDSDVATLLGQFRMKAQHFRAEADDTIFCFERVLAAPPADLRDKIFATAGFVLNHVTPEEVRPYSNDEMIAWLRDIYDKLHAIYDETAPKP